MIKKFTKSLNKILVICGPTAIGKTTLGINLAKKYNGEIISADSRQVYKYMDIGTGKEWDDNVKIWGYDLVEPFENFSVFEYFNYGKLAISDIWTRNKLPIIVGGTGLYIKSLTDGIATVDIPRNDDLRNTLINKDADELFDKLAILDSTKAANLNSSDKKNSRRLIRAIEVAMWNIENVKQKKVIENRKNILDKNIKILKICLTAPKKVLIKNIEKRVDLRMNKGFIDEIENLLKLGVSWKHQSMNSLGYKEAEAFFKEGLTYEEFIEKWVKNEIRYAKRQITWFKKDKNLIWFDVTNNKYPKNVEKLVKKWDNI